MLLLLPRPNIFLILSFKRVKSLAAVKTKAEEEEQVLSSSCFCFWAENSDESSNQDSDSQTFQRSVNNKNKSESQLNASGRPSFAARNEDFTDSSWTETFSAPPRFTKYLHYYSGSSEPGRLG